MRVVRVEQQSDSLAVYVRPSGPSEPTTQEQLDAMVEAGTFPALTPDSVAISLELTAHKQSGTQFSLFLDKLNSVQDLEYFESYNNLSVHRLMLQDRRRTQAYADAIAGSAELFAGKVVMDVGCGTGILSMFAARAGAHKVVAVEASGMAEWAARIVEANQLSDIITVVNSPVEEIAMDYKVDIIISEWMGFYLLHESMLNSVLVARDRFLAPGGTMFPSTCSLYASLVDMTQLYEERVSFWGDPYGFDMSVLIPTAEAELLGTPEVCEVKQSQLMSDVACVMEFDCGSVQLDTLKQVTADCDFTFQRDGFCHGLVLWFDVDFPGGTTLSCSPQLAPTHWKQTVVMFGDSREATAGQTVGLQVELEAHADSPRHYHITVSGK